MNVPKQQMKILLSRRPKLGTTLLIVAISLTQIFGTQLAFADDGGYPWMGATALDQLNSDYGYSTCPPSDSICKNYPSMNYVLNGTTYGEADPWIYNLRNCTSYVAWKINQVFGVSVQGWGNATSWDTSAAGHYTVYTGSSHTPQVGEIAQWDAGVGHVAYVYAVNNGIASLDEYNVGLDGLFYSNRTTASTSAGIPDHYIHIRTLEAQSPFLIRTGTDIQGKPDLSGGWSTINGTPATDIRDAGDSTNSRISYTDTNGHVWAKDGLNGTWYDEYTSPSQYAASNTMFVIRTGTNIQAKVSLSDGWSVVLNNTSATDVRVSGNRITYTDTNGHVWARDGIGTGSQWYDEYTSPSQYVATSTTFLIRTGTNIQAKNSLGSAWSVVLNNTAATDIRLGDSRITYTDTNGDVWARDGLGSQWYDEYTSPSQYAVSGTTFLIRTGTNIQAKVGLGDSWSAVINNTQAVDARVYGSRITYTDNVGSGDVWARDGLGSQWYDEYTAPSQYTASNT